MEEPLNIIGEPQHVLSPFSAHEVEIDGVVYKTAEHAYQTLRVIPEARERIMNTRSPRLAWEAGQEAKQNNELLENYDKLALMELILRAKLAQHADVHTSLRNTKGYQLHKIHSDDYFWGTGTDGTGENRLGKLWMKLRDEL